MVKTALFNSRPAWFCAARGAMRRARATLTDAIGGCRLHIVTIAGWNTHSMAVKNAGDHGSRQMALKVA